MNVLIIGLRLLIQAYERQTIKKTGVGMLRV